MNTVIKKGSRILSISESFKRDHDKSVLAGVVYRLDGLIDGIAIGFNTIGGNDSTENILRLYKKLHRKDINYMMISGAIISWFNILDIDQIYIETGIPVIVLSYEETEGIIKYLIKYFRDWEIRLLKYLRLGERTRYILRTGYEVYIRSVGIDVLEAGKIVDEITYSGRYPEPIKIARMIAHAVDIECL